VDHEELTAVSQASRPFAIIMGVYLFPNPEFLQSLTKQVTGTYSLAEHEISKQHQTLLHSVAQLLCFRRINEQAAKLGDLGGFTQAVTVDISASKSAPACLAAIGVSGSTPSASRDTASSGSRLVQS
jgi:hypothetical protein